MSSPSNSSCTWFIIQHLRIKGTPVPQAIDLPLPITTPSLEDSRTLFVSCSLL